MSTVRVGKRPRYTVVDRRAITDERLSFKARGLLVWLLDKPDDWRVDRATLAKAGPDGEHAIRSALNELRDAGYLVWNPGGDNGGGEHVLFEVPPEMSESVETTGSDWRETDRSETRLADFRDRQKTKRQQKTDDRTALPEQAAETAAGGDPSGPPAPWSFDRRLIGQARGVLRGEAP